MNDKGLIVYKTLHETVTYLTINKLPRGTYLIECSKKNNSYVVFSSTERVHITVPGYLREVGSISANNKLYRLAKNEDI